MEESKAGQAPRGSGDRVPEVTFRLRRGGQWVEKPSIALFSGRRVVVFAVPAAFSTPCSARHLPGYVAPARHIERMGLDAIFCVAANDPLVMKAGPPTPSIAAQVAQRPN